MRPKATIKDGQIICPHCNRPTSPSIVQDAVLWWGNARIADGEKVIATHGASYEVSDFGNTRLHCIQDYCYGEFDPPEGWEIDWR